MTGPAEHLSDHDREIVRRAAAARVGDSMWPSLPEVVNALERIGFHTPLGMGTELDIAWAERAIAHARAYIGREAP